MSVVSQRPGFVRVKAVLGRRISLKASPPHRTEAKFAARGRLASSNFIDIATVC